MACRLAHNLYLKTNCANKPRRGNLTIQSTKQMKKFLLSLLALFSFTVLSFGADDAVISELTFPSYNDKGVSSYTDEWTATVDGQTWAFSAFNNNNNAAAWTYIKCGRKNNESTATIMTPQILGGQATKLVLTIDKTANVSAVAVTPYLENKAGTPLKLQLEKWVQGEVELAVPTSVKADQILVTITNESAAANGPTQISKLVLYGISGEAPAVAAPVITPATGTYFSEQQVTITCATEGAIIYYARKGVRDPEGTLYKRLVYGEPFTVSESEIIDAWAVLDGEQSQHAIETLTIAAPYTSIAEANAAATETRTDAGIQADNWLVTYVNGQYTYLTDGVAGLLLFGNGLGLEQGQKVSGLIKGQLYSYNGLPEVASPNVDELEVMSEGNEVAPIVVASAALAADKAKWVNMFVRIEKAESIESYSVEEGARAANYDFDDDDVFTARNAFRIGFETEAGEKYNLEGFYAIYNEGGQLYPTTIEEFQANLDFEVSEPVEVGICTYARDMAKNGTTNFGAQPIVGWTVLNASDNQAPPAGSDSRGALDQKAAGVFAYGSTAWLGGKGYNPPAAAPEGSTGKNCLGLCSVWGGENAVISYTQDIELEGGHYIVTIPVFNAAGTNALTENNIGIISPTGMKYMAETKQYPVGEWTTETITLDVADDDTYTISLGIVNGGGSGTAPHLFIDGVYIESVSEEDISRKYLEDVIAQAEKLLEEPYGLLFTKTEDAHNDLESAVEAAEEVLNSEAPTAYDLDEASRQLLIAIETYENSEMILPDPDALYTIKLKEGGNCYMSVTDGGTKLAAEPVGLHFAETDNGYSIANSDASYYAACTGTGTNVWSMAASTTAYDWVISALPSGEYTISKASNENQMIGINKDAAATAGTSCYADKSVASVGDRAIWIIEEYTAPATVLEGIAALKAFTLDEGVEEADVVLRLTDAKVTFSGVTEQTDIDYDTWEEITVEVDNVVMEDATAGNLFQKLGLNDYLKKGDTVSGDIEMKVVAGMFGTEIKANDKTAASLEALTIENGEATPLAVTDENVEAYAENFDWIYAAFTDAVYTVSEDGDPTLTFPVLGTSYGIMDNLGIFPEGLDLEEGDVVSVEGYIWNYMGMMTIFQPTAIEKAASTIAEVVTVNTARGAWMYDAANNRIHYGTIPESGATDEFKFAFVEKDGEKFLYSIAAQKFVQPQKYLVEGMSTPVTIVDGDGYKMVKAANSNLTINIGGSQFTWDTWTAADDGNKLTIEPVGEFDAADALAMLEKTPIDQHKVFNIITKRGQWAASADGASLGTTDNNPAAIEADKQFAFYYDGSKVYIYSVGAKKFIKNDGSFFEAKGDPVDYRLVSTDDYNYCFFFTDNLCYFNMQNNGARYSINTWSTPDDGNREHLAVVEGVDVYDEMDEVFHNVLVDVEYELVYDGKVIGTATGTNVVGKAPQLPAELDNELCSYTYDVETIAEDTKKVVATAEWAGPFEFSTSFDDAKWYNMKIRGDYYIAYDETEPYYPTTDKNIFAPESQWAFMGDPYNVVIVNRALSQSWSLSADNVEETTADGEPQSRYSVVMREGALAWDIFGNGDGFVLREKGTETNYVNQAGGASGPLAFWNSANGRRDGGSTIVVEEATDALVLSTDVDYYKGQNGLNYEIDFTEALEYLGIESLDEATIAGVDVTTDVEVENYTIFDGWRNANGDYEQWGENAAVCVKFIEEPEQFAIYDMGNDNVPEVGETFVARFHIKTQGKTVVYNINVNFVAPPAKYLADYTEKGSFDITIFAPEKGVAFDGVDSEIFEETTISDLIGMEWSEVYGKGITDEVGETFATVYSCDPEPGFWCLEDGTADVYDNGTFGVSLIPAEDWSTMNFRAWTKEALTDNLSTAFYFVNEETKEYVTYNVTLSAKPAVNLVGEFDGFIKQILSHPQTGKQGEASGDQKVTITEGEEPGTYNVTFSGFTMPVTGAILPEFTITGVETVVDDDGTAAHYVLPAWAPQTITIGRGTGSVTYDIQFEGAKEGNDTPILKLTLTNSVVDEVYFGADEKTVDKAIATDEADAISGVRGITTADNVFDLSGRKVEKIQKSGVYIVNGKKVSIK